MSYGIKLKVWGDFACFTRPEMKAERVSYDVPTPSAVRGIIEAIYWKPQIRWIVDRIHVLKPIRFANIRRNEVSHKMAISGKAGVNAAMKDPELSIGLAVEDCRQQRANLLLQDVAYVFEAHIELLDKSDPIGKHLDIFNRRARKGQYHHAPVFGCREFPVSFELLEGEALEESELANDQPLDLGYMLYDMIYTPDKKGKIVETNQGRRLTATPHFYRPKLVSGVIDVGAAYRESLTS